jgi:hypothetical protein
MPIERLAERAHAYERFALGFSPRENENTRNVADSRLVGAVCQGGSISIDTNRPDGALDGEV